MRSLRRSVNRHWSKRNKIKPSKRLWNNRAKWFAWLDKQEQRLREWNERYHPRRRAS